MKIEVVGLDKAISKNLKYVKTMRHAVKNAMNEAARTAQKEASAEVRKIYAIDKKTLEKNHFKIDRATVANNTVVFTVRSGGVPLLSFVTRAWKSKSREARMKTKGARYKIYKGKGTKVLKGSFMEVSKKRKIAYIMKRKQPDRYPLRPQTVITPTSMFEKANGKEVYVKAFMAKFRQRIKHYTS